MDAKRRESLPTAKPTNLAARVRAFSERLREPAVPSEGEAAAGFASPSAEALESLSLRREGLLVVDDDGAGLLEEEERRRSRVVFDLAPEARFVTDDLAVLTDANVAATELLGLEAGLLRGHKLASFVAPYDQGRFRLALTALASEGATAIDLHLVSRVGASVLVTLSASRAGDTASFSWCARRASVDSGIRAVQQAPAAEPVDALQHALEERERMLEDSRRQCSELTTAQHERDVTMAVLAHELRGPMSAILGWTRLLRHPRIDPEQRERALEVIEQNALLQRALVDDLMDASRLLAHRVEIERLPLDLSEVVRWVADGAQPRAAEKGITLSCAAVADCVVQGDGWRLSQVVTNLLANSLKFTPTGGSVSVTLSAANGVATLRVADTGVGIAPEHLPRIFDRFHQANQAHNSAGGLGLGLFLVREIVEMHGGTVIGESPGEGRGEGSVFTVTLPLSTDER